MSLGQTTEILKKCSFLTGAGEEILAALAEATGSLDVDEGETVVTKGEPGSVMYFIASGRLRVHDGDVVLAHLGAGEVFGEMAVLDSDVRSASVTADRKSRLLSLERDDLWRTISRSPAALKTIIASVLQRERSIVRDVTTRTTRLQAYERELEIGRRIQADFLPEAIPEADGWEIATFFEAAREVAGDFFDAFTLPSGKQIAIVIGDVCDKGVGAALFMTLFRSLIRAYCQYGVLRDEDELSDDSLAEITLKNAVDFTNRYIATTHSKSSMFASVFFGILDPGTGRLLYVNGGHESPMVFRHGGGHETLEVTGGVVGLFPFAQFQVAEAVLNPGDQLLSYTDGVNEAKNERGEQFTEDRILDAASAGYTDGNELLRNIVARIIEFRGEAEPSDDITMLALHRLDGD